MSMIDNLELRQNRLARRLVKLERALRNATPEMRRAVKHEGRRILSGKINIDLIRWQTRQHPQMAERGVQALLGIFGSDLGPREQVKLLSEDDDVYF
jgi:hypothetical protein